MSIVVFTSEVNVDQEGLHNIYKTCLMQRGFPKKNLCFLFPFRATTVRFKGRNLRIKAPMCRALKKLCDPDGECEHTHCCRTRTAQSA